MSGPKNAAAARAAAAKVGEPAVMPDGRVEFEGYPEEYALLETHPTHGEFKRLFKIFGHLAGIDIADAFDESTEVVATLLKSWKVKDRDGEWLGDDAASIERCPSDKFMPIYQRCAQIFKAIPTPKP